jgi:hypothetical protein
MAMKPGGWGGSESTVEKDLASGRGEEVGPAHDFRDAHGDVVNDNSEFIGGYVVSIPNQKVSEVAAGSFFDPSEISILKDDGFPVRNAEAPVNTRRKRVFTALGGIGAPFAREDGFLFVRSKAGDFLARMAAGIDATCVAKVLPSLKI